MAINLESEGALIAIIQNKNKSWRSAITADAAPARAACVAEKRTPLPPRRCQRHRYKRRPPASTAAAAVPGPPVGFPAALRRVRGCAAALFATPNWRHG